MKYEWRKQEKEIYGVKQIPRIVNIPTQQYIMIEGKGNPNDKDFSDKVSALYSLAYAIKMLYKKNGFSNDINDFTVYPLEAIWKGGGQADQIDKNLLEYKVMIRQPVFITKDIISEALKNVSAKKPNSLYKKINFDTMHDGKCIEILHIGSYDDEPESFKKMNDFIKENNLNRVTNYHREIYLNNTSRVTPSKLKTILRYFVQ